MRRMLIALVVSLGGGGLAHAGLYNTAEQEQLNPDEIGKFQDSLLDLWKIVVDVPPESALRQRSRLVAKVDSRGRGSDLDVQQRVNLAAYLIRLGKPEEAVDVLRQAEALAPKNFMVLANLAMASQLSGQPERAVAYQEMALKYWPKEWPGLDKTALEHYHEAETYQLKLFRLLAQDGGGFGRPRQHESLNALFPLEPKGEEGPVRFVGDSGEFEAGTLGKAERAKLPRNAIAIVEQLLLWQPQEWRLYWLLGELVNARGAKGDVAAAKNIFRDLSSKTFHANEFQEHRRVLDQVPAEKPEPEKENGPSQPAQNSGQGQYTRALVAAGIGAAAGMLIATLLFFQIGEIRRRRQGIAAARKG